MTVSMKQAFEVCDDGTSQEVEVSKITLSSNSVYCIVDNSNKSIYLWKGSTCGVRKRFAGAQTASRLRHEQGSGFRVKPLDEGEEPSDMLSID
jgi:hypothetical protein